MSAAVLTDGPKGDPITGHLRALRRDALGFLTGCAREWGDHVPLRFGRRPALLLSGPAAIEHVLVGGAKDVVRSPAYRSLRGVMGNGLFVSDGAVWRRQRRLVQPAFHRDRVAAASGTVTARAERLLTTWADGEVRDVQRDMRDLTLRIITTLLVGDDVGRDQAAVEAALAAIVEELAASFTRLPLPLPAAVPTPGRLRLRRVVRGLDGIIYRLIAQRRAGDAGGDLLGLLLRATDDDGRGMTDRQLRDEVIVLALNGHETTALGLAYALDCLARHPAAAAALRDELAAVLGGRPPTAADLPRLRYTEMVVLEALRLYPPLCTIGREVVRDCTIDGRRVARGTILLMSQWVVQRDPRFFADAERFIPERWADGLIRRLPRGAYFPFGGGQRRCIGDGLAMLEMALVLATVAQHARFDALSEEGVAVDQLGTLRPRDGLRLRIHRR